MGFDPNQNKGAMSDINVTPFVDVVLVLLVIFMVTAPMMFNGISLTLPKTKKVNRLNLADNQVILSVSQTGDYFLGKEKILHSELINVLRKELEATKNQVIYIRAHYALDYGTVAKLMSVLKSQGLGKIALVTEVENDK